MHAIQSLSCYKYLTGFFLLIVSHNMTTTAIHQKINCCKVFETFVVLACIVVFALMVKQQYVNFTLEQTGTSLQWRTIDRIPFPPHYVAAFMKTPRQKKNLAFDNPLFFQHGQKNFERCP